MIFNSVSYLLFFPVVVLLYFVLPRKVRNVWLLVASYYFYMSWNVKYALILAGVTLITYVSGLLIAYFQGQGREAAAKGTLAAAFAINIGILITLKYNLVHILLPIGVSFYMFQALSYTMDVYRGDVKATKNLLRYALFVAFFPPLVSGPINRSKHLLAQFEKTYDFDVDRVRSGLLTMLWGLFMKIVIADNLSGIVTRIYGDYLSYSGVEILLATALFAVQIYCDFAGYSNLAIGSARVLGFRLADNFEAPYLATSVNEFWKRWHISLTSWFRDYLYIPLGGNRKGKSRRYINVMIVFLVSGMWHGADWTYVIWGGLNGLYLVAEQISEPLRKKAQGFFKVDITRFSYRFFASVWTFVLIGFSWMFFQAESLSQVVGMLRQIKANFGLSRLFGNAVGNWGLDAGTLIAVMIALVILVFVDICTYRKMNLNELVLSQGAPLRYVVYGGLLLMIMVFGVYGYEYAQNAFIYFQF